MKRTMYEAARHTPKRKASGSNPLRRTKKKDTMKIVSLFFGLRPELTRHSARPPEGGSYIPFALLAPPLGLKIPGVGKAAPARSLLQLTHIYDRIKRIDQKNLKPMQ